MGLRVIKAGGSVMADREGLHQVATAVGRSRQPGEQTLIVASALATVTDQLEKIFFTGLRGGLDAGPALERLGRQHFEATVGLKEASAVRSRLAQQLAKASALLARVAGGSKERLPRSEVERLYAGFLTLGERLNVELLAGALCTAGLDAVARDAETVGLSAVGPRRAGVWQGEEMPGFEQLSTDLRQQVVVLTGFYGVDAQGDAVLFGRGGSDYTAGVMAAALKAKRLEFWKDVPGILSADPRRVPEAELVRELTFAEAKCLGQQGAPILFPSCLEPLRSESTDIWLRAPRDDHEQGTRLIPRRADDPGRVLALVAREARCRLRFDEEEMRRDPGFLGRVLRALEQARLAVRAAEKSGPHYEVVVSGCRDEVDRVVSGISLVDASPGQAGLEIGDSEPATVVLVGEGVHDQPTLRAQVTQTLAGVGMQAGNPFGAEGQPALFVPLEKGSLDAALGALHGRFFSSRPVQATA